jgi:hypothetical protein
MCGNYEFHILDCFWITTDIHMSFEPKFLVNSSYSQRQRTAPRVGLHLTVIATTWGCVCRTVRQWTASRHGLNADSFTESEGKLLWSSCLSCRSCVSQRLIITSLQVSTHTHVYIHLYVYRTSFSCKARVKMSLCLTKHHAMKMNWRSGGIAPHILDFGTRWRWVVSFTLRPL